jgi:excisionase family DNA binding protein
MRDLNVKWVPSGTAARLMGVSRQRVYALIKSGRLTAIQMDGRNMVSRESVDLYIYKRAKSRKRARLEA